MLKRLKYVPSLLTVLTLLVSGPALAQVPDSEVSRDHNLEYYSRITNTYFETDLGMTKEDYSRLQRAEGYLREGQHDKALTFLRDLRERYPEVFPAGLLLAKTYLVQEDPEQALLVLEDLRKQIDPLEESEHGMLLDVVHLQVQAHKDLKHPDLALRTLQTAPIQIKLFDNDQREDYYLVLAKLMYELKQPEEAYRHLQSVLASGQRGSRTRSLLLEWSPMMAEQLYGQGLQAYRENNYARTLRLALMSYQLNPSPVKYSQLVSRAQDQIHIQVNQHFQNALPSLSNAIRNMRYALLQEDYGTLHKEYMRLREIEDVAFFLNRDYEGYLPTKMQEVLREVETELTARGYKI